MEHPLANTKLGSINNYNSQESKMESAETNPASNSGEQDQSPEHKQKFLRLPLARVKSIMKKDTNCGLLSQDAVFLVTKATEMFIAYLSKESGQQLATAGKRKTVMKKDVESVIHSCPQLCFLDGALD